jgi:S1-C subfamily serine protease
VVRSKRLGDHVAVGIVRDHKSQTITVTLGDQRGGLKQ